MPYGVCATKNEGVYSRLDVWGIPEHQEKNISLRVKGGNTFLFDYRAYGSDLYLLQRIEIKRAVACFRILEAAYLRLHNATPHIIFP